MEERNDTVEGNAVDRRYFVVRQEYTVPAIRAKLCEEIKLGKIRQGWGINDLDLRRPLNDWIESYLRGFETTDRAESESRFKILKPLLEIQNGGRVIVPKQPDDRHFIVANALKSTSLNMPTCEQRLMVYEFDVRPQDERGELGDDFRHVIPVDPSSVRQLAYMGSLDLELIKKKMRAFASAVNNVWDSEFKGALDRALESSGSVVDEATTLGDVIRADAIQPYVGNVIERLRCLEPRRMEKLIELLFVTEGFDLIGSNLYNGQGGDLDRVFSLDLKVPRIASEFCPNLSAALVLHVQVKQKKGIDQNDYRDLQQLIQMRPEKPSSLQRDIFISTADSFTSECRRIAQREDIALVDGRQLAQMVLRIL